MDRVAQRILDAGKFRRYGAIVLPGAGSRDNDVGREAAVHVDAENACVGAHMPLINQALRAVPADPMALTADVVAYLQTLNLITDFHYLSGKFVPHDARRVYPIGGPAIPAIDMIIGATNRCRLDAHLDLVRANDLRLGYDPDLRARSRFCLHNRLHCGLHGACNPFKSLGIEAESRKRDRLARS
jgi:hypothetical protein